MRMKQTMALGALLMGSSLAMAGMVITARVGVMVNADGSGTASGSLVAARFSNNVRESIGCAVTRYDTDGIVFTSCFASQADGMSGSCMTLEPSLADSLNALSASSWIGFSWFPDGTCNSIIIQTASFFL